MEGLYQLKKGVVVNKSLVQYRRFNFGRRKDDKPHIRLATLLDVSLSAKNEEEFASEVLSILRSMPGVVGYIRDRIQEESETFTVDNKMKIG